MKMRLEPIQTQKQILTPFMQQSMQVLVLPIMEMNQLIEQELQDNPLLEVNEEVLQFSSSDIPASLKETIDSFNENFDQYPDYDEEQSGGRQIQDFPSLEDKLLKQLRMEYSDSLEWTIGEWVIGNINQDGYLTISPEEISARLNIHDVSLVEEVLTTIQSFDPPGIAARDLRECLLIQLREKFSPPPSLAIKIVEDHLAELGNRNYVAISKALKVPVDRVKEAVKIISSLDPRPARNYRPLGLNTYVKSDVIVAYDEKMGYQVVVNDEGIPPLRVNTTYWRLLRQKALTSEDKAFIRQKMRDAIQFIRSIQQRGETLRKVAQYILDHQKDFFENGIWGLAPLTLKDVAQELDRNESTISRAIHNKYMNTPQGLFPLKFFFSQGISPRRYSQKSPEEGQDNHIASRSIKEEIKNLIDQENKSSPLSDQEIVSLLNQKGVQIARRTIAKYRDMLRILPSNLRKE